MQTKRVEAAGVVIAFCLLIVVGVASMRSIPVVSAGVCDPQDSSSVISRFGCGGFEWELVVQDQSGDVYDEGAYNQSGMCGGGFTDCDCNYVDAYTLDASKDLNATDNGDGTWSWYWNLYGYNQATYGACTSGACESTGETETQNPSVLMYQGFDQDEYIGCSY